MTHNRFKSMDGRKGIALVEYALVTPLLLILLAVGLNYGLAMRTADAVSSAARAGAAYASASSSNAGNTTGIQAAATNAAPDVKSLTVTSSQFCQCPGGASVSCGGSCTGNMLVYVQVNVHATTSNFFSYSGLSALSQTSAQVSMRVQ